MIQLIEVMLICGLIGSVLSGLILDKTKRFEELSKICFGMATIAAILFTILSLYDNDRSTVYYLILISFALIGFFGMIFLIFLFFYSILRVSLKFFSKKGLPLLPICMEMSVECVYPIPEATSTGLLFIAGQLG